MIGQTKWIARGSWCEGRDCGHRDPRPAESEFWLPAGALDVSEAERCRGWDASCFPKTRAGGSREARSVAHLCFWNVFLSRHQATGKTWFLLFKTTLAILTLYFSTSFFEKGNMCVCVCVCVYTHPWTCWNFLFSFGSWPSTSFQVNTYGSNSFE